MARGVQKGAVMAANVDTKDLEAKVKDMYRAVAQNPHGEFHFEMGRVMAERLGYSAALLARVPPDAMASFAGVGHFFHLAALGEGRRSSTSGAVRGWTRSSRRFRSARKVA